MSETLGDLSRALGVKLVDAEVPPGSNWTFGIMLLDLPRPTGFEIRIQQSLMSTKAALHIDSFPAQLLNVCKQAFQERRYDVEGLIESAQSSGFAVEFSVNGISDLSQFGEIQWESIELSLYKKFDNYDEALNCLKMTSLMSLAIMLSLVTEESDNLSEEISKDFELEGTLSRIQSNKYERSRLNRAICLEIYGFVCQGCDIRMADLYGPIGDGVIHVHHFEPVSLMASPRVLNPALDLIPLCPNCHTIIHKQNPPFTLNELKELIRK
jgi:5-methylcytosine-specific restriction protein A